MRFVRATGELVWYFVPKCLEEVVTVLVIVGFLAMGIFVLNSMSRNAAQQRAIDPCWGDGVPQSVECLDYRVHQCMALEYTKDQCVTLVGSK